MHSSAKFILTTISMVVMVALIVGVFATGNLWFCSLVLVAIIIGYRAMYIGDTKVDRFYVNLWLAYSCGGVALSLLAYLLAGPSLIYVISFFFAYFLVCLRPSQFGV